MKRNKSFFALVMLLVGSLLFVGCQANSNTGSKNSQEKTKVTFALDWTPNTNHSGLFLARDLGYFAEEGLEVDLQQSDMSFLEMVGTGAAQFGIASQEQVLQARAASGKVPVVSVAAILQHNTSGFASKPESGITRPKDFEGKTYSGWGTELELAFIRNMMEHDGGDFSKVNIVNQSATDFFAALDTEAQFVWIYAGWDGVSAKLKNYPLNFMKLQDVNPALDFYSPTIIANEKVLQDNPELAKRFLRAAQKGYQKAIDDPQAAVDAILKEAPELSADMVRASQDYVNQYYIADAEKWGHMKPEMWSDFGKWMADNKLLDAEIKFEDAYSNDYLP